MAKPSEFKFDATKPFYASIGAAESVVDAVRQAAEDVQEQLVEARAKLADVDRDPKVLVEQAREQLVATLDVASKETNKRIDLLQKETNKRITAFQTEANKRVDSLQGDLRQLPTQVQARVVELQS